jgi:CMP-N-acetylneuraminic acid synthetase
MKNIIAIVPARKFDERLPGKNVLEFAGTNLLIHKLRQLKKVKKIGDIIVSSDEVQYLNMAQSEGVSTDLRPLEFADKNADFGSFVNYISSKIECNHILWASPTSPMVDENDYDEAIKKYLEIIDDGYDSLITVNKIKRYLLDANGPLNFRFQSNIRNHSKLPILYEFTNGIVIAPRNSMIKWRYNWGAIPFKHELPFMKTLDICNLEEYEFAKYLATKSKS